MFNSMADLAAMMTGSTTSWSLAFVPRAALLCTSLKFHGPSAISGYLPTKPMPFMRGSLYADIHREFDS